MFLDRVAFFYSIEGLTYVQESQPCLETFAIPAGYHMFRHRPSAHTPVHSPHTAAVLQNHIFHTMIPPSLVSPRCQALCRLCLKPDRGHDSHIVVIVAPTQHFSTFRPSDSRKLSSYSRNPRPAGRVLTTTLQSAFHVLLEQGACRKASKAFPSDATARPNALRWGNNVPSRVPEKCRMRRTRHI